MALLRTGTEMPPVIMAIKNSGIQPRKAKIPENSSACTAADPNLRTNLQEEPAKPIPPACRTPRPSPAQAIRSKCSPPELQRRDAQTSCRLPLHANA